MIPYIIIILIIIVAIAILFAILKNIVKAALFIISIAIIIFIILGAMIAIDVKSFKDNMQDSKITYLLVKSNQIIEGIEVITKNNSSEIKIIDNNNINEMNKNFKINKLKKILNDNYKIILINSSTFDGEEPSSDNFQNKIKEIFSSPPELISGLQKKEVQIYPETMMFKTIQYIPSNIVDTIMKLLKPIQNITNKG